MSDSNDENTKKTNEPESPDNADNSGSQKHENGSAHATDSKKAAREAADLARDKVKQAIAAGYKDPMFLANMIDGVTGLIGKIFTPAFIGKFGALSRLMGQYALLLMAPIFIISGIVFSIKTGAYQGILWGVALGASTIAMQYIAAKMMQAVDVMEKKSKPVLAAPSIVSAMVVLWLVFVIFASFVSIKSLLAYFHLAEMLMAIFFGLVMLAAAAILLHPEENLDLSVREGGNLADELVALVRLKIRLSMKLVPFIFGIGAVIFGVAITYYTILMIFNASASFELFRLYGMFALCAFSPLIVYMYVLIAGFFVELATALLGLGKK